MNNIMPVTHVQANLQRSLKFIKSLKSVSTSDLEMAFKKLDNNLDELSVDIYEILKENRHSFTSEERLKACQYIEDLLNIRSNLLNLLVILDSSAEKEFKDIEEACFTDSKPKPLSKNIFNKEKIIANSVQVASLPKFKNERFIPLWECDSSSIPKIYYFNGNQVEVSSWSDLFIKACEDFYQLNELKMRSFVGRTEFGNGGAGHSYFKVYAPNNREYLYFKNDLHGTLYVEKEYRSLNVRNLILKLLDAYGFKDTDFLIEIN